MTAKRTLKIVTVRFGNTAEDLLLREILRASSQEGESAAERMKRLAYVGYLALKTRDARFRKKLARKGYVDDVLKEPDTPSSVSMADKSSARPQSSAGRKKRPPEKVREARQEGKRREKSLSGIDWVDEIMEEEESLPMPGESLPDKRPKNDANQSVKRRLAGMFPQFE